MDPCAPIPSEGTKILVICAPKITPTQGVLHQKGATSSEVESLSTSRWPASQLHQWTPGPLSPKSLFISPQCPTWKVVGGTAGQHFTY